MKRSLLRIFLVLAFAITCKAQTYVLIPDVNFATYLQSLIPSAMNGNSLNITSTLVTATTQTINVSNQGISNLSGIQYFSSLIALSCNVNSLTTLPALPNSLQVLSCGYNSLTSLPDLPNSLIALSCNNNSLTSLPTLPNALQSLHCHWNNISCFPTFPSSILLPVVVDPLNTFYYILLDSNPFTCLPNHIQAMAPYLLAMPLCSNPCVAGIEEITTINTHISVYPNPNIGLFKFQIDEEINNGKLVIINALGQKVHEQKIVKGENNIATDKVISGLYHYILLQNKQQVGNGKLIIE